MLQLDIKISEKKYIKTSITINVKYQSINYHY